MPHDNERRDHDRDEVNLLVRVRYENIEEFIFHFATNISPGGMFLQSRKPHPKGTILRFQIRLKGGRTVLRGRGEVTWSRPPSSTGKQLQVPGMGVKFLQLDEESKNLVRVVRDIKDKKSPGSVSVQDEVRLQARKPERSEASQSPKASLPPKPDENGDAIPPAPPKSSAGSADRIGSASESGTDEFEVDIDLDDFTEIEPLVQPKRPTGGASSKVIGIDLGTTNTCAAVVLKGSPQVIPTRRGYRTIPSVVAYTEEGRLLVGHQAKAQMEINPKNTVYGSKRLIGRRYDSPAVQQMKDRFHYDIIPGPNNEAAVRVVGREFSLQQVAAFVLGEIRDVARELMKEEVNRAVITVPAYFDEMQRKAVRQAGVLAGLDVERIVNEPTAAALAFGFNRGLEQKILVYDLGGGTFDASVLDLCDNIYEVLATGGDMFLGGVDFDNQLVDYLLDAFTRSVGAVPLLDRAAIQRLRDGAELAKCALSEKQETIVRIPFLTTINNAPKDLEVRVTRQLLEELVAPLVERSLQVAKGVLAKAGLRADELDNILLVGGQSRMPYIWQRIREVFGKEASKGVHPDEAVAIGAALLGDSAGKIDSVVLIDVLPISIGVGLPGGQFQRILESGTALPTTKSSTVRTYRDNQEQLELLLFQGGSDLVVDNEYLGTVVISGITPAPKGTMELEVSFSLDTECLLKVSSREIVTGKAADTRIEIKETEDSIREKLMIPEDMVSEKHFGVSPELFAETTANRDFGASEELDHPKKGKLFGKFFGRNK